MVQTTTTRREAVVPERRVTVAAAEGLHARPAALFVRLAAAQPTTVTIRKDDGDPVAAGSILAVMALGAKHGDAVVVAAEGPAAEASLDALEAFLTTPEP